jgi:hypothetical protein
MRIQINNAALAHRTGKHAPNQSLHRVAMHEDDVNLIARRFCRLDLLYRRLLAAQITVIDKLPVRQACVHAYGRGLPGSGPPRSHHHNRSFLLVRIP